MLHEGAYDFIAELIIAQERQTPYIEYGKLNEERFWRKFKFEMYGFKTDEWLYKGGTASGERVPQKNINECMPEKTWSYESYFDDFLKTLYNDRPTNWI